MPTVTIVDESLSGSRAEGWALEIFEERLRLDEIIRRRIYQEVTERDPRTDWRAEYERALDAFRRNGFVVLVGGHQVTELEHEVELSAGTEVTFLKLIPLVGG
ncbi:hypothetical protein [Phytohabitans rumicis]|nr:hypothetical protein [Phytohabitans rumicis]